MAVTYVDSDCSRQRIHTRPHALWQATSPCTVQALGVLARRVICCVGNCVLPWQDLKAWFPCSAYSLQVWGSQIILSESGISSGP